MLDNIIRIIIIRIMFQSDSAFDALPELPFVGRTGELALLDRLWAQPGAQLLVLYGRRRTGKTRLLTRWIRQTHQRALFWSAYENPIEIQLREFSKAIFNFANPAFPAPHDFTYATWEQALAQVAQLAGEERLALFLDEFTFLIAADRSIPGVFQKMWDQVLERTNLFLCLTGSHLGMMHRGVLDIQAPLYGRASALKQLLPLPYGDTQAYFPHLSAEERVTLYAIFGGVPMYWKLIDQGKPLETSLVEILYGNGQLIDNEANLLLHDYLSELRHYTAILKAIAGGMNLFGDIQKETLIPATGLPQYLNNLQATGYVARYDPVTARNPTKLGRYSITDPFLRFYFRFLFSRRDQLALGEPDQAFAEFRRHLRDFIGAHTWEELCREWVLRAANRSEIPLYPDYVESAWTKTGQIDVVGLNRKERHLVLGECKWTAEPQEAAALRALVAKTALAIPDKGKWKLFYLGFAKNGWTTGAKAFAAELGAGQDPDSPHEVVGCRLLDLDEIDAHLTAWAAA